ncbi:OmpH family outer membrane protein [Geomesophilobacter sediminis]|nr:OmpH family outer membrane protein [Geomesophilobacter sediminis]
MKKIASLSTTALIAVMLSLPVQAADTAAKGSATNTAPVAAPTAAAAPNAPAPAVPAPGPAASAPSTAPAGATTATSAAPALRLKIGYVDLAKVGEESKEGKTAIVQLKARSEKLRAKIEARQKSLEKQKAAIEAKIETMTAKEKAAKSKEFQKKVEEYQKLVRSSEEEMRNMQDKYTETLFEKIKDIVSQYAVTHGYDAIVAKKEALYLSPGVDTKDLTDEIVAELDKRKKTK